MNLICCESCILYSSGVILCCVKRQFPLVFYGGTVSEVDCKFSHWVTCISQRREMTEGREWIGTIMMMQFSGLHHRYIIVLAKGER